MKKLLALLLALCLTLSFAACGKKTPSTPRTAETYAKMIADAREKEDNDSYAVVAGNAGAEATFENNPFEIPAEDAKSQIDMLTDVSGFALQDCDAYAFSMSLINVRAYCIGVFRPVAGKEAAVKDSLQAYITAQQKAFENYLPDQYEVTKNAEVRTAASGEIILVMSENAAAEADKLEAALKA